MCSLLLGVPAIKPSQRPRKEIMGIHYTLTGTVLQSHNAHFKKLEHLDFSMTFTLNLLLYLPLPVPLCQSRPVCLVPSLTCSCLYPLLQHADPDRLHFLGPRVSWPLAEFCQWQVEGSTSSSKAISCSSSCLTAHCDSYVL